MVKKEPAQVSCDQKIKTILVKHEPGVPKDPKIEKFNSSRIQTEPGGHKFDEEPAQVSCDYKIKTILVKHEPGVPKDPKIEKFNSSRIKTEPGGHKFDE